MANENEDTKRNLLIELESIQGLLGEDDIPVLQEVIDELDEHRQHDEPSQRPDAEALTEQDLEQLKSAYRALTDERGDREAPTSPEVDGSTPSTDPRPPADDALPGQQGLFDEPGSAPEDGPEADPPASEPAPTKPRPQGENPFLPQHIRERLRGNRAGDFTPTEPRLKSRKELVDELVSELTPRIESALRLKLAAMTERELAALSETPHPDDE